VLRFSVAANASDPSPPGSASSQQQHYLRQKEHQREQARLHQLQVQRERANLLASIRVLHEDFDYAFLYKPPGLANSGMPA
jgi:23S rRNA-/tRNA-specific pseudouridylate synthase